jgi:hypothetical protein
LRIDVFLEGVALGIDVGRDKPSGGLGVGIQEKGVGGVVKEWLEG